MTTRRVGRLRTGGPDRGATSLELVAITPVIIVIILVIIACGRVARGYDLAQTAAADAARAAALAPTAAAARTAATAAAAGDLAQAGVSCHNLVVSVDTATFRPGGQVSVSVSCTANLSTLALAGVPGSLTLTASASQPLEQLRQFGSGP